MSCFSLDFQHERKIVFRTIFDFFIRNLPSVLDFKVISVHFLIKPENAKTFNPTFKIQFRQTRWLISSQDRNHFFGSAKMRIKKTHQKVFSSQSNLLYPKQAVSTTVSKIMAENTMFFLMEIGRNFQKKVSFVEQRLFQIVPMYTLIVNRTALL